MDNEDPTRGWYDDEDYLPGSDAWYAAHRDFEDEVES